MSLIPLANLLFFLQLSQDFLHFQQIIIENKGFFSTNGKVEVDVYDEELYKSTLDNKNLSFKIHVIFMETQSIFSPKVCPLCIQELIVDTMEPKQIMKLKRVYEPQ